MCCTLDQVEKNILGSEFENKIVHLFNMCNAGSHTNESQFLITVSCKLFSI